jgi:hypothetical protein
MPLKLFASDRRLVLWAMLILLPVIIALALLSSAERDSGVPSTYSAGSSGAKASFLMLEDLGYRAQRWEQSPSQLPAEAKHTVLVLAGPVIPPSDEEQAALRLYLARGGTILATGFTADLYLPDTRTVRELLPEPVPKAYRPQLVSALARAGEIRMSPEAYWKTCSTACMVHYSDDSRPIVVSYKVGEGEVIWWAASMPLSNGGVLNAGNLTLLLNSLGAPAETHVFWDEYFHGARRPVRAYIQEKPVVFGLAQLTLLVLALLLTYSRRNGPVYPAGEPSRLSPLEFVETVGALYRRAHAVRAALEVPYTRFRNQAIRQLALKNEISARDLARAIGNRFGRKDSQLEDLLERVEIALYDPELSEAEALKLVQELNAHAQRLQLIAFERQEIFPHAGNVAGAHSRKN